MICQFANGDCAGRLEWHHVIRQQRLRRTFAYGAWRHWGEETWRPVNRRGIRSVHEVERRSLDELLGDVRNRVFLCSHHHELVTNGRLKVELPDEVWAFAAEFGLTAMLENDLRKAA